MIRFVLMDVEGTTTSIAFVHDVLFPYAARHLREYIARKKRDPRLEHILNQVKSTVSEEEGPTPIDDEIAILRLEQWISEDRKHPALKTLQGHMWREGYETGQYQGHVYPDVVPTWQKWRARGIRLGIYSSGSVEAQKLLFGHSEQGDLRPFLDAHFDTRVGHKREPASYTRIRESLDLPAKEILFLSDVEAELDAAGESHFQTCQVVRPGTRAGKNHRVIRSFLEVENLNQEK
jgi:enolase-phosphatase E1